MLIALPAGQGIEPDAKKLPMNIFWSSRARGQLAGGRAASRGQPSAAAEGVSLAALLQSPPVAVSWGQIKLVGREPVRAQVLCCASPTDTVLYLARGEEKPSAAQVRQPKMGTGTLVALGRVLFTWLVRLGEEVGALPSDEQPFAQQCVGKRGEVAGLWWPGVP